MSIPFTNIEKIYYPKGKITKGDVLKYYEKVSSVMLPFLKSRPLVMKRFPNGIKKSSFFQKNVENAPNFVKTAPVAHKNRTIDYVLVQNKKTLMYVANLGSIEMHCFHSRFKKLDKPDYLLLDLDPTSIHFDAVVEVAQGIHKLLEGFKIPHYCKTSGGTGLHILIPTKGKYTYEETKKYARIIGKLTHELLPDITSLERSISKRKKKVYIDCMQNAKSQLMIAPYSLRATQEASVSTPLSWKEVKKGLDPKKFTIKNIPARVSKNKDLWSGFLSKSANLKVLNKKA